MARQKRSDVYDEDDDDYKEVNKKKYRTKRRNQHNIIRHATEDYLSGMLSEDDIDDWLEDEAFNDWR
jgi:hypothetical protein